MNARRTLRKAAGWSIICAPFIGLYFVIAAREGYTFAVGLFAGTLFFLGAIYLGLTLVFD